MEPWLFFAIATIFTSGLHNFSIKVAAERNYNVSIINLYTYIISSTLLWIYLIFHLESVNFSNIHIILLLAIWNSFTFFLSLFTRVKAMQKVDAVIFFPLYKTFWPIIITLISIFFFKEILTTKEIIWIIIWISVPLLLITNSEKKRQNHLFLWVTFIILTAILTAFSSSLLKEAMVKWFDPASLIFISSIFGFIFSLISLKIFKKEKKKYNKKWIWKVAIISWLLHLASFATFTLSLTWNLAVVFTISSFSILIPIILSIIVYKDHFNIKKWIVIILSIISIILFI